MSTSGRRGVGLALEEAALAGELAGKGEDARDGRQGGEKDGRESNHFDVLTLDWRGVLRMRIRIRVLIPGRSPRGYILFDTADEFPDDGSPHGGSTAKASVTSTQSHCFLEMSEV